MKVCVTGDFHGLDPPAEIPDCELLLIAGDIGLTQGIGLDKGRLRQWLAEVPPTPNVVAIAGNHDFETGPLRDLPWTYLQDESATVAGMKIWGSPWSPTFYDWAFMRDDPQLAEVWEKIPTDVDIILVHGPPHGYCDYAQRQVHTGSMTLRNRIERGGFDKLKLVACGHIHEGYGIDEMRFHWVYGGGGGGDGVPTRIVQVVNGAWVDERFRPGNPPIVVEL